MKPEAGVMSVQGKAFSLFACLVFTALGLIPVQTCEAGKLEAYSAEQVQIRDGKAENVGNIHVSPGKLRMEIKGPSSLGNMIIIVRQNEKVSYTLFPNQKHYVKKLLNQEDLDKKMSGLAKSLKGKETDLGIETVNGYRCRKKSIETTMSAMGRIITTKTTVWISEQVDFPMRSRTEDGDVKEIRNIRPGKQPGSLFELPEGYTEAANMMEVMAGGAMGRKGKKQKSGRLTPTSEMPERLRELLFGPDNRQ